MNWKTDYWKSWLFFLCKKNYCFLLLTLTLCCIIALLSANLFWQTDEPSTDSPVENKANLRQQASYFHSPEKFPTGLESDNLQGLRHSSARQRTILQNRSNFAIGINEDSPALQIKTNKPKAGFTPTVHPSPSIPDISNGTLKRSSSSLALPKDSSSQKEWNVSKSFYKKPKQVLHDNSKKVSTDIKKDSPPAFGAPMPEESVDTVYVTFTDDRGKTISTNFHFDRKTKKSSSLRGDLPSLKQTNQRSYKARVNEFLEKKDYKNALVLLQEVDLYQDANAERHYLKAKAYLGLQKESEAKSQLLSCLLLEANHALCHFELGSLYFKQKLYVNSAEQYKSVLRLEPQFHKARLHLAISLLRQKNNKKAIYHLKRIFNCKA